MTNLLSRPSLMGTMVESPDYRVLGAGFTDRVFLVGHADGLPLHDPYQVVSMRDTVRLMGGNPSTPLMRSLLEAYYAGARDIWLVAAARLADVGGPAEQYYDSLAETYSYLEGFEVPQLIVPVNAPLYGTGPDFAMQLATHCETAFGLTGATRIGVIGAEVPTLTQEIVDALVARGQELSFDGAGKFVLPVVGSAVHNIQEEMISHVACPVATVAATISQLPLNRGMTYMRLPGIVSTAHADFTPEQQEMLCQARLNPLARTQRAKRGNVFETVLLTDNMFADEGSDYWSLGQVRLVQFVIDNLRRIGSRHLGTIGFPQFKEEANQFMLGLFSNNTVRDYSIQFHRVPATETHRFSETVKVEVMVRPYFGVRQITFSAEVGPGL